MWCNMQYLLYLYLLYFMALAINVAFLTIPLNETVFSNIPALCYLSVNWGTQIYHLANTLSLGTIGMWYSVRRLNNSPGIDNLLRESHLWCHMATWMWLGVTQLGFGNLIQPQRSTHCTTAQISLKSLTWNESSWY